MIPYILFLTVFWGNPHTVAQEFISEQHCLDAKASLEKSYQGYVHVIACVKQ